MDNILLIKVIFLLDLMCQHIRNLFPLLLHIFPLCQNGIFVPLGFISIRISVFYVGSPSLSHNPPPLPGLGNGHVLTKTLALLLCGIFVPWT